MKNRKYFYDYLVEMAAIAHIGLLYSRDPYALENYQQIKERTEQMLKDFQEVDFAQNPLFPRPVYPTPNVSVRTVCFNPKGEVLLVREASDGGFSLPGGWCDLYDSPKETAENEFLQETGAKVKITQLVGVLSRIPFQSPVEIPAYIIVFRGEIIKKVSQPVHEITEVGFFSPDYLPPLSPKITKEENLRMIHAAKNNEVIFD
ncbi:MAG: NUDIX hydrolase N-terminal domain-containing protein [Bacilli bacterium]|jgi:8-oxo-dGTP diphosphatase